MTYNYIQLNAHYCVFFSSKIKVRVRTRIRLSVWLINGYTHLYTTSRCHFTIPDMTGNLVHIDTHNVGYGGPYLV